MATTSVPQVSLSATGYTMPQSSAILAGEQEDISTALGGSVDYNGSNVASQIATTNTAVISNTYASFLALANGIDPAYATGRMLDAICRIYFLTRIPAESTVVQVTCSGLPNTQIPVTALIQDANGYLYNCTQPSQIPASGSIVLQFQNQAQGPIPCGAQTFTIYQAIPGWDSAISTADGALGSAVETNQAFRQRRASSVAGNSVNMLQSIRGALLGNTAAGAQNVPGILDCYTTENPAKYPISYNPTAQVVGSITGSTLTVTSVVSGAVAVGQSVNLTPTGGFAISGVTLPAGITITSGSGSSFGLSGSATVPAGTTINLGGVIIAPNTCYIAVAGGDSETIAQVILSKKGPGCGYTGNTTVTAYDTATPYVAPGIAYPITFEVPTDIEVYFLVALVNNSAIPSDGAAQIQAAIISAFNGEDGGTPAQIGATVQASRFVAGITGLGTWAQLKSLTVGTSADSAACSFTASIAGQVMTVTAVASGSLSLNQIVTGAGVSEGTFISSFGTGSGGVGTYNITTAQTVASEAMTARNVTASSFSTTIAQMPVTSDAAINVVIL